MKKHEAVEKIFEHLGILSEYDVIDTLVAETLANNIRYAILDIDSLEEEGQPSDEIKTENLSAEEVIQLWEKFKSRDDYTE